MTVVHDFKQCLEYSHSQSDQNWWGEVYKKAFPSLIAFHDMRHDGWWQRGGIDRLLILPGRTVAVDEKVRTRDYGDILLEYWSVYEQKKPGWAVKDQACDFIAYAIQPTKRCYLLPFHTMRLAVTKYGRRWLDEYGWTTAQNHGYTTKSVAVPTDVLMSALGDVMLVGWGAA